jgi:eukaryotic-like serine/threonine-protein kinase
VGDDTDFVKVLDFGIAARKDSVDAQKEQKLTQQGMVLGTPPYMSPEQFMGKELDARSDIYSLAVMAYEMLTGRLPFDANTPWEWATKHMTAQPFPFEDQPTVTDVPGKMKHAILRAMAKNPTERHGTVREFFEDLSIGAARMQGATTAGAVHPGPAAPETAVMSPYDGGQKGKTEVGAPAPASVGANFGSPSTASPGGLGGLGGLAAPPPPPPRAPAAGGGNKGLILGAVGVGAVGLILVLVLAMRGKSKDGDLTMSNPFTAGSGEGTTTVAPLPGDGTVPPGTVTTVKTTTPPTGTATATATATATSSLSGDAACADAIRQAGAQNIPGANASYRNCSGPNKENARRAIAAAVPGAVRSAVFRNDCKGARNIASQGGLVGANVNVDTTYPQCKGK